MSAELSMASPSMSSKVHPKQKVLSISTVGMQNPKSLENSIIVPTTSPSIQTPLQPLNQSQPHGESVKSLVVVPTFVQVDDIEEYEHKLQVIRVKPEDLVILTEVINKSREEMKQRIKRYIPVE